MVVLAATVAGCSSRGTFSPSATHSSLSTPTASAAAKRYGDVIPLKSVTDEYGTYEQTTIAPDAPAMKLARKYVTAGATSTWSDADLLSAQQFVVKFAVEEGMDSTALDNRDAWTQWQTDHKSTFDPSEYQSMVVTPDSSGSDRASVINNDLITKGQTIPLNPVMTRDGGPRVQEEKLRVSKVDGGTRDSEKYVDVYISAAAIYRTPAANAYDRLKALGQSDIASQQLIDGTGTVPWDMNVSFTYDVVKSGDGWVLSGDQNQYNGSGGDGWAKTS